MARKKNTPILTHTELLCLAYRTLDREVQEWRDALAKASHATEEDEANVRAICSVQLRKMDAIQQMYFYETGMDL
jgi:hypothetical protein